MLAKLEALPLSVKYLDMRGKYDELLTFWARPTLEWDLQCENIATAS